MHARPSAPAAPGHVDQHKVAAAQEADRRQSSSTRPWRRAAPAALCEAMPRLVQQRRQVGGTAASMPLHRLLRAVLCAARAARAVLAIIELDPSSPCCAGEALLVPAGGSIWGGAGKVKWGELYYSMLYAFPCKHVHTFRSMLQFYYLSNILHYRPRERASRRPRALRPPPHGTVPTCASGTCR